MHSLALQQSAAHARHRGRVGAPRLRPLVRLHQANAAACLCTHAFLIIPHAFYRTPDLALEFEDDPWGEGGRLHSLRKLDPERDKELR